MASRGSVKTLRAEIEALEKALHQQQALLITLTGRALALQAQRDWAVEAIKALLGAR